MAPDDPQSATPRRTRLVVVALVVALVVVVAGAVVRWSQRDDGGERRRQDVLIDAAGPSVCRMEALAAAGSLAELSNVFWDEVHTGAHVLAARLTESGDRAAAARFLTAKGAVESALPLLAPSLTTLVPRFAAAYRAALVDVDRPATATCT